jgi:hypothetical protein
VLVGVATDTVAAVVLAMGVLPGAVVAAPLVVVGVGAAGADVVVTAPADVVGGALVGVEAGAVVAVGAGVVGGVVGGGGCAVVGDVVGWTVLGGAARSRP